MTKKIPYDAIVAKWKRLSLSWNVPEEEYDCMNTQTKVDITCSKGHTWNVAIHTVYRERSGCPECARPSSEATSIFIMETLLGKRFKKTRRVLPSGYELDGYNPELKLAIEYNGAQHYIKNNFFHRDEGAFESQQARDKVKRQECIDLGITLITVHFKFDTFNKIREYIQSKLIRVGYDINENLDWEELKTNFRRDYDPILDAFNGIKELVEEKDGTVLSSNYVDRLDPMRFKCEVSEHPEFEKTPADIRRGVWCNQCAHNAPIDENMPNLPTDAPNINDRVSYIRNAIERLIDQGVINENMIPLIKGRPDPSEDAIDLLKTLDPCGVGSEKGCINTDAIISEHMQCCRVLSYFGNSRQKQILICLKTLIVFTRSRDSI